MIESCHPSNMESDFLSIDGIQGEDIRLCDFTKIFQQQKPIVIRALGLKWKGNSLHKKLEDDFQHVSTRFRVHKITDKSVAEGDCDFIDATFGDFFQWCHQVEKEAGTYDEVTNVRREGTEESSPNPFYCYECTKYWAYCDYKHVQEEFGKGMVQAVAEAVDWDCIGCTLDPRNSTLWLGSKGAHTPLHYDTYGSNLVAQLHGRKRWKIYPPSQTALLYPTRIPFEESTVYSQVDPLNPDLERFPKFSMANPITFELGAGDVLFLPKHWWHFVECLGDRDHRISLTTNLWVDMDSDALDRIEEALVRFQVGQLTRCLDDRAVRPFYGPGEAALGVDMDLKLLHATIQGAKGEPVDWDRDLTPHQKESLVPKLLNAMTQNNVLEHIRKQIFSDAAGEKKDEEGTKEDL